MVRFWGEILRFEPTIMNAVGGGKFADGIASRILQGHMGKYRNQQRKINKSRK